MTTNIETLRKANWDRLERDVVMRIRLLRTAVQGMARDPISDKLAEDLFMPCIELLGSFVGAVDVQTGESGDPA